MYLRQLIFFSGEREMFLGIVALCCLKTVRSCILTHKEQLPSMHTVLRVQVPPETAFYTLK